MGSADSYSSVIGLIALQRHPGVRFRWRPFHLLLIPQEMQRIPVADQRIKSTTSGAMSNDDRSLVYLDRFLRHTLQNNRLRRTS
jgi:hypothetical protein